MSFRLSWEINGQTVEVIGDYKTLKAAYDSIKVHVKDRDKFASPYYRIWQKGAVHFVDYGKHNAFYKIEER
ncbi:TPA: hypothetical protein SUY24_001964 [Streptococcus equi subsp. equi]|uniref:hypothetical protein n=1 Tax=Streptococcus equi TaxID=1336 RepID=UPI0007CAFF46|nr:hypothetical protein [Streptococcus equi]ASB97372.1 hypothetical protein SE071780_01785 [Streptococcus equi subsp. equi]MBT1196895.1 hypothetical protein [Streptococcus equi subsp. equi]MBT1199640.1 hypothetical protein [Streptococcus equi subsp. equi]MBT1219921.1 hypothetical protein [Streptococcus equi subsp. equi]MBT1221644.1 hypothetical protein [Streptococcus equi subsp. equi]